MHEVAPGNGDSIKLGIAREATGGCYACQQTRSASCANEKPELSLPAATFPSRNLGALPEKLEEHLREGRQASD